MGLADTVTKARKTTYEERIAFVKECIENGYNYTEISEKYKVGYQQIYTWVQKYKKDGEDALKDRRGRHKKDYKCNSFLVSCLSPFGHTAASCLAFQFLMTIIQLYPVL